MVWNLNTTTDQLLRLIPAGSKMVFMSFSSTCSHLVTANLYDSSTKTYPRRVSSQHAQLEITRHPLSGSRQHSSAPPAKTYMPFQIHLIEPKMIERPRRDPVPWRCNRVEGLGLYHSLVPLASRSAPPDEIILISYNYRRDELYTDAVDWTGRPALRLTDNVMYHLAELEDDDRPSIWFTDPDGGAIDGAITPAGLFLVDAPEGQPLDLATNFLHADENFLLILSTLGLQVWCFHESIFPPGSGVIS